MSRNLIQKVEQLDRRVKLIRKSLNTSACTCRGMNRQYGGTKYHTPEELEVILYVPCPIHGLRDPGAIWSWPSNALLERPDWKFCTCPPDAMRDYRMGRRSYPTDEELALDNERKEREWMADYERCIGRVARGLVTREEASRELHERNAQIKQIISTFWKKYHLSRGSDVTRNQTL